MSDKNLETVVRVEWGGGFTLINCRDNQNTFAVEDCIPLSVGSRIEIKKTGRIRIKFGKTSEELTQIREMTIYDEKGRATNYRAKSTVLVEYC